jgi:pimeloyl-ACP methyl ester carboxylesterase
MRRIEAGVLEIACEEHGPPEGDPVVLLHGFPYDVRAFDEAAAILAEAGCRVVAPWLRGYGPTRFLSSATPRSGQQAALGADLRALMDALGIGSAILAGYDWGGRAACIVAALWPERARGLVSVGGYNIQDIAAAAKPLSPEQEHRYWYQYYFHSERGRAGLAQHRGAFCRLLWRLWSPAWRFEDATFERSEVSFDNPDFVDVVVHSYRHRFGLVAGDPAYEEIERLLAQQPRITVPTVTMDGGTDGVASPIGTAHHARFFDGPHTHRVVDRAGHNLPQEAPREFADAILSLLGRNAGPGARAG